jgi:hypothetical protein
MAWCGKEGIKLRMIPAYNPQEANVRGLQSEDGPGKKSGRHYLKNTQSKMDGMLGVAQAVDCPYSKHETLNLNPSTTTTKEKKKSRTELSKRRNFILPVEYGINLCPRFPVCSFC